ncbi:protein phosphatase 1 regulatory inhibitor subunit PPP1R8 homolog [Ricinus communis]|uniref:Nuclear inhibitor of protein phosphatase-1, putative n=1 Tax=Ricinus communis TaxID=3988 RepID=B9SGC5_RICCO|nr:protein phosphatase 1 regulatory inhibitor subunit PPP1R8 homolog [Ricinus communis]XP_025014188.1 protein phosphatase 1 regulatory inhibitor subunit PPP1R8 homolog [Ricinus communis]EEF37371.1 nuclear inhibitor of protein phosphatase-1, putative [Ricinus communis]|eukprot:XP_002525044.1 protein phosphatase 1 regulatory inhibitor subunit PPP1R8 homolog [Ricinus communis]
MYGRAGLDRFKKAQSSDPFSVSINSASKTTSQHAPKAVANPSVLHLQSQTQSQYQYQSNVPQKSVGLEAGPLVGQTQQVTQVGGGQSAWLPPDWAIEPRPGVYYLEVLKDGEVLDRINLDRRRHIFGRQAHACDFVLDHQSVSRQHAAVIPHKNGSIFVIDLGSAHGTFVANERLTKDAPVELEVGQSLRFAASTRTYILRKNDAALFPRPPPSEINLPPPPDPTDEEAVVAYNTLLNRYGLGNPNSKSVSTLSGQEDGQQSGRATKRLKKARVVFKDQVGGELVEVVGFSDGADVETEPGPLGVKEGSLVGKYESLIQTTVIPKGKEQLPKKENNASQAGVTNKLREVLNKVKTVPRSGIYDDLYGETFSGKLGSAWAYSSVTPGGKLDPSIKDAQQKAIGASSEKLGNNSSSHIDDEDDDLFGD